MTVCLPYYEPDIGWTLKDMIFFEKIVYQDNKSAINLEDNGKASSSNRTKHINIRYYFITDRIEKYELSLEFCTIVEMIGYFMTKPTQGAVFKRFRDQLTEVTEAQDPGPVNPKKYREDKISKHGQKASRNASPLHK